MRPISLKLKNVFQHEDLEFEFKPGITGVVGRNGSGKSNLLEALYFAISGKTGSDITKLDMLGWKGSAGSTEFRFEYDGVEYALTRNLHSALVSLSGKTLAKPLKNAEANAQVEAMLGTDPSSLYETCWTPQGGLVQVLVMSHAQRVAFFQRLADIRKAEVIRGMLQDSLNQLPNYLDRTEDIRKLAEEREGLHAGLVALENTNNALEDMHRQFKDALPDCQKILGLTTEDQYLALQKEAAGRLALQQSQLQTFLTRNVLEEVPAAEPPSREMEQSRYQVAQRGKLQAEMKDLQSRHDHLLAPACAQPPDEFRKEVQMRHAELTCLYALYKVAKEGTCPTCKRPYEIPGGEEGRAKLVSQYEAAHATYAKKTAELDAAEKAYAQYQKLQAEYTAHQNQLTSRLAAVKREIELLLSVTFDETAYSMQVRAYEAYKQHLAAKKTHEVQLQSLRSKVTAAEAELEQVSKQPYASKEVRAQAEAFMQNYAQLQEQRKSVASQKAAADAKIESIDKQLLTLQGEDQRRVKVAKTRILFERAREVLHRDRLPSLVMQKVLLGLNALLDRYLSIFETNFTAYINPEFDFVCSFSSRSDIPARALSGGQKVALALAFKFALSELLANQVPLLVLDEPTIWLDDINKPRLVEVLNRAREVTEKGVFVLVATHEPMLYPAFSRVFDVSEQKG